MKLHVKVSQLSFPVKVALVVGLAILIPVVVIVVRYLSYGTLVVKADKPNAYVVIDEQHFDLPYTATLRTSRKTIIVGAAGYAEETIRATVPSFRLKKTYDVKLTRPLLYEGDGGREEDQAIKDRFAYISDLPYVSSEFEISYPEPDGTLAITLAPSILTVPGVDDVTLKTVLKQSKTQALAWLTSKGAKTDTLRIRWVPFDPDTIK
jgi:hypothetical protein